MYYYPIGRVPQFWDWLVAMGERGLAKIPQEIFDEVVNPLPPPDRRDAVVGWLKEHQGSLLLQEAARKDLVSRVTEQGYADDLTEEEIEKVGRDPFLIAYALADIQERCVVTNERSRSTQRRANRHVPDVCRHFDVRCLNIFELIRELDFRTDWRTDA